MEEILFSPPLSKPLIFDTHAHYDDARFKGIYEDYLSNLNSYGVKGVITCGCDALSSKTAISFANKFNGVFAAVGVHPENIDSGDTATEILPLTKEKGVVAIGEIGLDYNFNEENKKEQIELFKGQIELSKMAHLPIIVHDRDAHADTLEILKETKPKGVVHCFSGSEEMAEEILKLGMYIGIGGVATFKNARRLPEVIKKVPLDRFLLETDCPYLAPEPFRGKLCHSGMIYLTAEKIALIKGISTEEVLNQAYRNAKCLFGV